MASFLRPRRRSATRPTNKGRRIFETLERRQLLTATLGLPWTQTAELTTSSDFETGDHAGQEVAISGDTIAVSSHRDDDEAFDAGAVYLYVRNDNGTPGDRLDDSWTKQQKVTASDASADDGFGRGVDIQDDILVVGAYQKGSAGTGKAYVFQRTDSTWSEVATLTASDWVPGDRFGNHVVIEGDTIVVTALGDDNSSGSAYVFVEPPGGWSGNLTQTAKLTPSNPVEGDRFGRSVEAHGEFVLIGAEQKDIGSGRAFVFQRNDNGTPHVPNDDVWLEQATLLASDGSVGDQFGYNVSLDGTRAVVSAVKADVNGVVDAGSAYVFEHQADGTWIQTAKLQASNGGPQDQFGRGLDLEGNTIVVGAWWGEIDVPDSGTVYFYQHQPNGSWLEEGQVSSNDAESANNFGSTKIDLQGDILVAGDPQHDHNGAQSGGAFVFTRSNTAVLFADSFEAGQWAGNWVEDSQNDWFTSSQRSTDGSFSAEVDGRATNATLTLSYPIDLSAYTSAELTFDWLIENGFDSGEYLALDISSNGGASWQSDVVRLNGNSSQENTWHNETVDLTPYASSDLLVRFRAKVSKSNEDANVDNVQITGTSNANVVTTISYPDFSDTSNLNLIADAEAPLGPNNVLRLTPPLHGYRGAAWHNEPQVVAAAFETEFEFQIGSQGEDGFAFVIQNDNALTFGGLGRPGFTNIENSLAVAFDTRVDQVLVQSDGTAFNTGNTTLGELTPSFDLDDGQVHHVKLSYNPGQLSIYLEQSPVPALTVAVDLSELLDLSAGRAWVGFTGETVEEENPPQRLDILNWTYSSLADTSTSIDISDSQVVEGSDSTTTMAFTVTRTGDLNKTSTVNWTTQDQSATVSDNDYEAATGQLVFASGEAEKLINVTINGDTVEETHEQLQLNLSSATEGFIGDSRAIGSILNDEVSISVADATVTEGDVGFAFLGEFGAPSVQPLNGSRGLEFGPDGNLYAASRDDEGVIVYDGQTGAPTGVFAASDELASANGMEFGPDGNLYVSDNMKNRILRFDGMTGAFIDVFVSNRSGGLDTPRDLAFGPDGDLYVASGYSHEVIRYDGTDGSFVETFVTSGSGGLGSPQALMFANGYLYVSDGMGTYSAEIFRYDASSGAFVDEFVPGTSGLTIVAGGGLVAGPDLNGNGSLDIFASSAASSEVMVFDGASGDFLQTVASSESSGLVLPVGLDFGPDSNLYVLNLIAGQQDGSVLRYGAANQAAFTVSLSSPSGVPVTVDFDTADITATADSDYAAMSGTLTFEPGVTLRTIIVPTFDDAAQESTETFDILLSNVNGATVGNLQATGTILDDGDVAPPNAAPVAVDDGVFAVEEDDVLQIAAPGLLANDSDAEGDSLTAIVDTDVSHGTLVLSTDGSFTYTPAPDFHGSDSFAYVANDGTSDSNVATVNLTVTPVNDVPIADPQNVPVKENTPQAITLSGSDVDGDPLSFSVLGGPTSGNLSGTVPNLTYTPDVGFTGADSFTFVVNDATVDSAVATVSINVAENNVPVADPQAVSVDEDAAVAIGLTGSDPDSDPVTFQIVDGPLSGSLTGTAPNVTYTPDLDFNGADSFTFKVNDGTDDSPLATVALTVNPVNDAPAADAQSLSTAEDTALAITLSGDDIDGDPLSYIVVAGPANGSLGGSSANHTYTPNANFNGNDSFTFKVNDGQVDSAPVTVSIDVSAANDAPVARGDSYSLDQDTTLSVVAPGLLGNDNDVDGDSITASLITTTGNGSLSLASDGSFDYTPDPGFIGSDSFSYQVGDGTTSGNTVTVSLTVNAVASGPNLSHGEVSSVGGSWQTVTLATSYTSMVVIATPRYNSGSGPGVARVRNATDNSFEVRVDDVGSTSFSGGVHYVVVEEGVYDEPGQYKLEAVKYLESRTSRKGGWLIDTASQGYQQDYNNPVVVGQVMSANDPDWSVFWASSGSRTSPPSSGALNVGKHVAEDPDTTRADETIGYLVIEATQDGTIEGLPFVAGVGGDSVRGVDNGTYQYSYEAMPNAKTAVLSSAGMDGGDGGWAVLRGNNPVPAASGTISLSIDEDQLRDSERKHTTEQVAYFVINLPLAEPVDASGDGSVTSLDAWPVINQLSQAKHAAEGEQSVDTRSYDINGDGVATAIDLLIVINRLNRESKAPTHPMTFTPKPAVVDAVWSNSDEDEELTWGFDLDELVSEMA